MNVTGNATIHGSEGVNMPNGVVIGGGNMEVGGPDSIALGSGAKAKKNPAGGTTAAIAIGNDAETGQGYQQVAIGPGAGVESANLDQLAVGSGATTSVNDATALGPDTSVTGGRGIAVGDSSEANGPSSIAIGGDYDSDGIGASSSAEGAVAIGPESLANNKYEATFGNLNGQELDLNVTGNATIHQNAEVGSYLDVNAPSNEGSALDVGGTVSADGGIDSYDNVNIDGDLRVNGGEIDRSVYRTDAVVDFGPSEDVLGFSDSFSDGTLDPFQSNTIYTDFTVQNGYANHENLDDGESVELNLTTNDLSDNVISFRYRTGSSGAHEWTFNANGDVYSLGPTYNSWEWRTFNFEPSSENDFIWRYEGIGQGADFDNPGFEIDDVRIGEKGFRDSMNVFGSINAREGIDVKEGSVNMNGNNVNMGGGNITSSSQMCMGVYCE